MRLGKLENLDLSFNQLNSSILSILSGLSSLIKSLDLSFNKLNSSIFPSLTGFSSLKSLDLSGNQLTGSGIIHSFYLNASHDILLIILFLYQQK